MVLEDRIKVTDILTFPSWVYGEDNGVYPDISIFKGDPPKLTWYRNVDFRDNLSDYYVSLLKVNWNEEHNYPVASSREETWLHGTLTGTYKQTVFSIGDYTYKLLRTKVGGVTWSIYNVVEF